MAGGLDIQFKQRRQQIYPRRVGTSYSAGLIPLPASGDIRMTLPHDVTKLQSEMSAAVREHWKAFLFEGILLVILGLAAMILPPPWTLKFIKLRVWMVLISGVAALL